MDPAKHTHWVPVKTKSGAGGTGWDEVSLGLRCFVLFACLFLFLSFFVFLETKAVTLSSTEGCMDSLMKHTSGIVVSKINNNIKSQHEKVESVLNSLSVLWPHKREGSPWS